MRYAFLRDRSSFRGHTSRRPRAKTPSAARRSHKRRFLHYTRKTRTAPGTAQNAKKNRWEMEHRKTHPGNGAHGLFRRLNQPAPRKRPHAFAVCQGAQPVFLRPAAKNGLNMRIQRAFPSLIPIGYGRASPLREHSGALIRSSSRRALAGARRAVPEASIPWAFQPTDTKRPKYTVTLYPIFVCRSTRF